MLSSKWKVLTLQEVLYENISYVITKNKVWSKYYCSSSVLQVSQSCLECFLHTVLAHLVHLVFTRLFILFFFSLYFSPWHSFKQSLQYLPDSSLSFCGCCATRMPNTRVWGKITNYCSSAPIVFKLGQNIKLSKCFKFLEKKSKSFTFWWRHHYFLEKIFGIFFFSS